MEDAYFIAMEYLFGKDLKSVFTKSAQITSPIGLENALLIAAKICEGLEYAHNLKDLHGAFLNIIHRDISPPNIFVTYDGKVKIIDFGIAKTTTQTARTQVGIIKGKVAYMSPEQAEGRKIDRRSDIFAAGILLYEMVTGQAIYSGDTMEVLNKAIHANYKPLEDIAPDLPSPIYPILHRALDKDIDERYQSCGEMMTDIENCLYEMGSRPNTKILEKYITGLFEKEYRTEKQKSIEILKTDADDGPAAPERRPDRQPYQKTMVIDRGIGAKAAAIKNDLIDYSKKIVSGKKKWILLSSVLILLILCGAILVHKRQVEQARQPGLNLDFIKKMASDIKEDIRSGKNTPPPEREPAK